VTLKHGRVERGVRQHHSGIVDQDVQRPDLAGGCLDLSGVGDIHCERNQPRVRYCQYLWMKII